MDQYLNLKLDNITTLDEANYPHLSAVRNIFIRGSVVRYVHLPANAIDTALLEDAARRGMYHLFELFGLMLMFKQRLWRRLERPSAAINLFS